MNSYRFYRFLFLLWRFEHRVTSQLQLSDSELSMSGKKTENMSSPFFIFSSPCHSYAQPVLLTLCAEHGLQCTSCASKRLNRSKNWPGRIKLVWIFWTDILVPKQFQFICVKRFLNNVFSEDFKSTLVLQTKARMALWKSRHILQTMPSSAFWFFRLLTGDLLQRPSLIYLVNYHADGKSGLDCTLI